MNQIDREATFKGYIVEQAVGLSTNDFPQLVARFVATELYDEELDVWVDCSGYEMEITAYLCLVGGKGETLTCQQLAKALPWNGTSFTALNDGDYTKDLIQFRVEEEEYDNKTNLRVKWVDDANAIPGRAIKKLDAAALKAIDAKYAKIIGAKKAPVKAPVGKPAAPKTTKAVTKKGTTPTQAAGPVKKTMPPQDTDPVKTTPPETAPPETAPEGLTQQEAWDRVCAQTINIPDRDEKLARAWQDAKSMIGQGKDDLTPEQWLTVAVKVVDDVGGVDDIPF